MSSTTYEHSGGVTVMCATQAQFCEVKRVGKIDHLGNVTVMVRNAGQLPQPFWLGAARGGGSCRAARCTART